MVVAGFGEGHASCYCLPLALTHRQGSLLFFPPLSESGPPRTPKFTRSPTLLKIPHKNSVPWFQGSKVRFVIL